jgi:hypothetical protein
MVDTSIRRRRTVLLLLPVSVAGLLLLLLTDSRSGWHTLGALLFLTGFIPGAWFVQWFAKPRVRIAPRPAFQPGAPFERHIAADFTLAPDLIAGRAEDGEYQVIFLAAGEGFTTRFVVPAGAEPQPGVACLVEAQFLRPEVALPRFAAGTEFSVLEGSRIIGSGRVRPGQ